MDCECFTELLPEFLEVPDCEVDILVFWSTEGTFKCVDVTVLELFAENSPTGALFFLHIQEAAIFEGECFKYFAHKKWKLLPVPGIGSIMAAIDEGILFHGMTMQVTEESNLPNLLNTDN